MNTHIDWFASMLVSLVLTFLMGVSYGTEVDLTFEVGAGKQECFYQRVTKGIETEIDYQVIDGGDHDINFYVISVDSTYVHADQQKTENLVKFTPTEDGDYRFCFDNTFSRMSPKVVFFELFVDDNKDKDDVDLTKISFEEENIQKDQLDMTVKDFVGILDRAKNYLDRSIQVQTLLKMHEAKDRNTQEANFYRVNMFSTLQVVVMVVVGLVQVYMIRNLFKENNSAGGSTFKQRT